MPSYTTKSDAGIGDDGVAGSIGSSGTSLELNTDHPLCECSRTCPMVRIYPPDCSPRLRSEERVRHRISGKTSDWRCFRIPLGRRERIRVGMEVLGICPLHRAEA